MKKLTEIVKATGCVIGIAAGAVGLFFGVKAVGKYIGEKIYESSNTGTISIDDCLEDVLKKPNSTENYYSFRYSHDFKGESYKIFVLAAKKDENSKKEDIKSIQIDMIYLNPSEKDEEGRLIGGYSFSFSRKKSGKYISFANLLNENGDCMTEDVNDCVLSNDEFKEVYDKFIKIHKDYLKSKEN